MSNNQESSKEALSKVEPSKQENSKAAEVSVLSGHSYDGIDELDNALPTWWINLFYLTVIFAAGYFFYYVIGEGPTLVKEYERQKYSMELVALSKANSIQLATEPELQALLKNPAKIKAGHDIFQNRCVSCHGAQGQGGIGPNLADDYWIHGGKMTEIEMTVRQGVLDKGMPPWGPILTQDEIHSVVSFVKSLRGSNPPNAKAPQGILVSE